jgi:hypothetical protein
MRLTVRAADPLPLPEPGPEDYGLRFRLLVKPRAASTEEGYDVQVDLLNTSKQAVTLQARWREDDAGDLRNYIDAAASIECVPAVAPWVGGVREGQRKEPQPEYILNAGEILSVRWTTEGRHLKNRVTNPNEVQNPEFPFPGLYSVHATINVFTGERTVRLRSNEQLVSVGGSRAMPKYTLGRLLEVNADKKTAMLGLGALHKVEPGDQFEIGYPKGERWRLTITNVEPEISSGDLEVLTRANYPGSEFPNRFMEARLLHPRPN